MSDNQHTEWNIEQTRVNNVIAEIEQKMEGLKKSGGKVGQDVKELQETFWNDVTVNLDEPDDVIETHTSLKQQAELVAERVRTQSQIRQQLKTLTRLQDSPYFGRIDFLEAGEKETESIYIGIASFMDKEEQNFLIYDWRAPISSLYYDYPPGPANYETPSGTISGEMELKRQFIIKNGTINGMFDSGVTIRDEMLQAVLGNNADTQMKSIVATIQKEQNEIIRDERSQLVIVQGVAGSGKTSAALQRVAYLLYRFRDSLAPENILLFSPNPLFNSYVATVLPELGEENMKQSTFQEYLEQHVSREFTVEDPFDQIEYMLTSHRELQYETRLKSIAYKNSLEFKNQIDQYVRQLACEGLIFRSLRFRKKTIISKQQIYDYFYRLDPSFSIANRLELVKEWLFKELKKRAKLEEKKKWVEEEIQFLDKDDFIEAYQQLENKGQYSENSFDDFDREQKLLGELLVKQKMKPLFNRVKNLQFINISAIYQQLFKHTHETHPMQWPEISELTITSLQEKKLKYEDMTPFVYLQHLILGKMRIRLIRHIFIDEAQDYSPFQFAFIKKMFPYCKMTLLGDINQAIYAHAIGESTALSSQIEDTATKKTYILMRTYRSTKPIVEFTSYLMKDGNKIVPFNREGNKPTARISADRDSLHQHIKEQIQRFENRGHETIAVICKTAKESHAAYKALKNLASVRLIEKGTTTFESGVVIIPSYLAKGIEFDAVIIYDSSQYQLESERKLFYTACTRAMHELHLATLERHSLLMKNVPRDKYTTI